MKHQVAKEGGLVLKEDDSLEDYLSCEIKFSNDGHSSWLGQPHIIKNTENKLGDQVKKI